MAAYYLARIEVQLRGIESGPAIAMAVLENIVNHTHCTWAVDYIYQYLQDCMIQWKNYQSMISHDTWQQSRPHRICIVTAAWQREDLFSTFIDHYKRLSTKLNSIEISFAVAVSDGDGCEQLCIDKNINFVKVKKSFSLKWQAALNLFYESDADFCLVMGSDDFISHTTLKNLVEAYISHKCSVIGIQDLHIAHSCGLIYWGGYSLQNQPARYGETIGAGRLVHRNFVNLVDGNIWGSKKLIRD